MIIEARLVDGVTECPPVHLATIERELTTDTLGLSLAEGKAILMLRISDRDRERPKTGANPSRSETITGL